MDRNHEFTVQLPDGSGTYKIALLKDAKVNADNGSATASLGWIDASGTGPDEDQALQALLGSLQEALGDESNHGRFNDFVREQGRKLTEAEVAQQEDEQIRQAQVRHAITDDEQYAVRVFSEAEIVRSEGSVTVKAFGTQASGESLGAAANAFIEALNTHVGEVDSPGPGFGEFTTWIRENGERVPGDVLKQERETQQEWERTKEVIPGITPDDIDAESRHGVPLLVDFWAEWCGPCRMVTPVLVELAEQWQDRIRIRKVDVEQFEGIWDRFHFKGIPAMLMFRDGEEIHRVIGFGGREALVSELEPHLG